MAGSLAHHYSGCGQQRIVFVGNERYEPNTCRHGGARDLAGKNYGGEPSRNAPLGLGDHCGGDRGQPTSQLSRSRRRL